MPDASPIEEELGAVGDAEVSVSREGALIRVDFELPERGVFVLFTPMQALQFSGALFRHAAININAIEEVMN